MASFKLESLLDESYSPCLFCLKNSYFHKENSQKDQFDFKLLPLFFKLLQRITCHSNIFSESAVEQWKLCQGCATIVKSVTKVFHQIQCLQLQLDWNLDKLKNVMAFADRVPSRVKQLQQKYNNDTISKEVLSRLRQTIKMKLMHHKLKCRSSPKVVLQDNVKNVRTNQRNGNHLTIKMEVGDKNPLLESEELSTNHFYLAWIVAFITIATISAQRTQTEDNYVHSASSIETINNENIQTNCSSSDVDMEEDFSSPCSNIMEVHDLETIAHHTTTEMKPPQTCTLLPEFVPLGVSEKFKSENVESRLCDEKRKTSTPNHVHNTNSNTSGRQLRRQHKCLSCFMTFSTLSRLEMHQKTSRCNAIDDEGSNDDDIEDDKHSEVSAGSHMSGLIVSAESSDEDINFPVDEFRIQNELQNENEQSMSPIAVPIEEHKRTTIKHEEGTTVSMFKCTKCPKRCPNKTLLQLHHVRIHGKKGEIKNTQISPEGMTINDLATRRNAKFLCSVGECKAPFYTKEELTTHSKLHGTFACSLCPVTTSFAPDIALHENSHSTPNKSSKSRKGKSTNTYSCNRCSFTGKWKSYYVKHHLETHLGLSMDSVKCPICQQSFHADATEHLERDIYWHYSVTHNLAGLEPHSSVSKCDLCPAYFLTESQLCTHKKRRHVDAANMLTTCQDCGKTFPNVHMLRVHRTRKHFVNENDFKFVCDVDGCGKRFEYKIGLDGHKLNAGCKNYKVYKCTHCGKVLKCKHATFERHVKNHEKQRPSHACDECGKIFKFKATLQTHKCAHTSARKEITQKHKRIIVRHKTQMDIPNEPLAPASLFKCENCPKRFRTKNALLRHKVQLHKVKGQFKNTQISPEGMTINDLVSGKNAKYVCSVGECKARFFTEEDLVTHSKLHGTFLCSLCPVTKTFAPDLALHEISHSSGLNPGQINNSYNCRRCMFSRSKKYLYIKHHLENHLGLSLDSVKCPICQQSFYSDATKHLKRNIYLHYSVMHDLAGLEADSSVLKCDLCPAFFLTQSQLLTHKEMRHEATTKMIKTCRDCGKTFSKVHTLRVHRKEKHFVNEDDFKFICDECGKKFEYKIELDGHKKNVDCKKYNASKCPHCYKVFRCKKEIFERHVQNHELKLSQQQFVCDKCGKKFNKEISLQKHELGHKSARKKPGNKHKRRSILHNTRSSFFKCEKCPHRFRHKNALQLHRAIAHGKKGQVKNTKISPDGITVNELVTRKNAKYFCSIEECKAPFFTEEELTNHLKCHGTFTCTLCPVTKTFAPDLALHENSHNSSNECSLEMTGKSKSTYSCFRCSFTGRRKTLYIKHHLEKHLGLSVDSVKCPICQQSFHSNVVRHLERDVFMHYCTMHDLAELEAGSSVYKCDLCPAFFLTEPQLCSHKGTRHADVANSYKTCKDCGKTFKAVKLLRIHRRNNHFVHEDDFKFVCDEDGCGKRFEHKIGLDGHKVQCKSYTVSKCPHCFKVFKCQKDKFERHVRSHEIKKSQKQFVCDECGKVFKLKDTLQRHMLTHVGPDGWQYVCEICSRRFAQPQNLKEHMRVHTKEKPFVCDICGEKYAHKHNWRSHMNKKHNANIVVRKVNRPNFDSPKGRKLSQYFVSSLKPSKSD